MNPQFLQDLFVTAVEGGINYWTEEITVTYSSYSATLVLEDQPDPLILDLDVLARGIERVKAAEDATGQVATLRDRLLDAGDDPELDYDADDADIIVQYGFFEEVVYG